MSHSYLYQNLSQQEIEFIQAEEKYLFHLQKNVLNISPEDSSEGIFRQIYTLRDSLEDANEDDIPQITEQIARLSSILNQQQNVKKISLDLNNPYFAHMELECNSKKKNYFIGSQVYRTKDGNIQIIDWRNSPISVIYYRYQVGDLFEEEIGERWLEGEVTLKCSLKIQNRELVRIQKQNDIFIKENSVWIKKRYEPILLQGGTGSAVRADSLKKETPKLGINSKGEKTKDKHLPQIAALLDEGQFELITKPASGVVAIQGAAGSGKTTVALHRVAWLHHQDSKRFLPSKMIVFVFNQALALYISKVLPSLEVSGVLVKIYEQWAEKLRKRLLGRNLPKQYQDTTPVSVIYFKKHPALLHFIERFISYKEQTFQQALHTLLKVHSYPNFPIDYFSQIPILERIYTIHRWMKGQSKGNLKAYSGNTECTLALEKLIEESIDIESTREKNFVNWWDELFSDFQALKKHMEQYSDFSNTQIEDSIYWIRKQYTKRSQFANYTKQKENKDVEPPCLDREDDPILLYLYQNMIGELRHPNKSILQYHHLVIDETQDLSPIELKILFRLAKSPKSITLAGDVNQKMIQNNSFDSWKQVFECLQLKNQEISSLKVAYRSTAQIMTFAFEILGELNQEKNVMAQRQGEEVELFQFSRQGELLYALSETLKQLQTIEPLSSTAVICHNPEDALHYFTCLEKYEIPNLRHITEQEFSFTAGIDITDIKQVKGLEFDYVILLNVDTVNYPNHNYSKYLLHIGATRATHQLWIMNDRKSSTILPNWLIQNARKIY